MSLYYMDTGTLLNTFLKEDPSKLVKAQFIIASTRIYKGDDNLDQVICANDAFYPSDSCFMYYDGYDGSIDKKGFKEEYFRQLDENKAFLATLILGVLSYKYTIFFLCSKKELKVGYLKLLAEYCDQEFHYPIYCYKNIKKGIDSPQRYDIDEVYNICDKIIKNARKENIKQQCSTERGRKKYVSEMSKSEMKKKLKKMQLYAPGLNKEEMKDLLMEFFVYNQ